MYINGLGYVEDATVFATPSKQVKTDTSKTTFDDILSGMITENNGKTYTLKEIFEEAAKTYGLPTNLLEAVGYRESSFDPTSTSSTGAMGIMQLMPGTAAELGVTDAYDVYQNIMGGAKYLKQLYDRFDGDLSLMLAAYNAGPGAVSRAGGIPSEGVQKYVTSILNMLETGVNVPDKSYTVNANGVTSNATSNIYTSSELQQALLDSLTKLNGSNTSVTETEYQLLMQYYENMMRIISNMGDTDDDDDDDDDSSSLTDLYKLGMQQNLGISESTASANTLDALTRAAKAYAAGSSLDV